jgi:hypothetical protein
MAKGGKVVHVTDELHACIKAYCEQTEQQMKFWVNNVLAAALQQKGVSVPEFEHVEPISPDAEKQPTEAKSEPLAKMQSESGSAFNCNDKAKPIVIEPSSLRGVPVERKPAPPRVQDSGDEPWSRPPFWQNRTA